MRCLGRFVRLGAAGRVHGGRLHRVDRRAAYRYELYGGITDAEARELPVLVHVANGGSYDYSLHASSMHCEVIGGKLYLVDPIPMNSVIILH